MKNDVERSEPELEDKELRKADGGIPGAIPLADPRPSPVLEPPQFELKDL